jgi:anti-anti-sigma factor
VVVQVTGVVDAYTAPLLQLCLDSQATQRGLRELVVDLKKVSSLGAAGVTVLARARRRCRMRGARLVIRAGGRRHMLRPLQLTGLADAVALDPAEHDQPRWKGPRTTTCRVFGRRPAPAGPVR